MSLSVCLVCAHNVSLLHFYTHIKNCTRCPTLNAYFHILTVLDFNLLSVSEQCGIPALPTLAVTRHRSLNDQFH